jgi:hypothetical protein
MIIWFLGPFFRLFVNRVVAIQEIILLREVIFHGQAIVPGLVCICSDLVSGTSRLTNLNMLVAFYALK